MKPPSTTFRVLGIDPGLHITGYAALDFFGRPGGAGEPVLVEAGTLRPGDEGDTADRIARLHGDLTALLADLGADLVAIERLYAHYKHPRTAILMAHARGVILLAARQADVAVRSLPATNVKKALTGNGHATKRQVQRAIQGLFKLDEPPEPPDVADAMAIALCAGRHAAAGRGR